MMPLFYLSLSRLVDTFVTYYVVVFTLFCLFLTFERDCVVVFVFPHFPSLDYSRARERKKGIVSMTITTYTQVFYVPIFSLHLFPSRERWSWRHDKERSVCVCIRLIEKVTFLSLPPFVICYACRYIYQARRYIHSLKFFLTMS